MPEAFCGVQEHESTGLSPCRCLVIGVLVEVDYGRFMSAGKPAAYESDRRAEEGSSKRQPEWLFERIDGVINEMCSVKGG